jgi:cell division septum initiation protein DivIVA
MNDEIKELRKEIASKHRIAVSRDDPILVLQTINNRLMQDSSKAQQIQLDHYKEELEDLAMRWGKDARDKAERILNAALTASKEILGREMQEGARSLAEAIRAEFDSELTAVMQPIRNAWRMAIFNVVAACITLLAAGVSLWVVFRGVK